MKYAKVVAAVVLCCLSVSCKDDDVDAARSFRMGFSPFPYDISLEAVEQTYSNISIHGDIINHHFDNGVPWVEALNGEPFSANIQGDWNFRKAFTPHHHQVLVSVAALNPDRNGMAKYRGDSDDMALPSPWDTYSFSSMEVRTAYTNYCKRTIEFFEPDYFNMNVEANLLHFLKPELWSDFLQFHQYVYQQLKSEFPQLTIFTSITGAHLLEGYFDGNDVSLQRLAALQLLEHSDLYGISFYPFLSKFLGAPYPENSLDQLFALSNKPIAIAETGYPAQTFNLEVEDGIVVTIEGTPQKQDAYLNDMLTACSSADVRFVIYFCVRDYDQMWQGAGSPTNIFIAWRDTGLLDENGQERMALTTWKAYFQKPLR
jgi:hypothetical protein